VIAAQRKPAGALRPSCDPMIGRGRSRPLQLAFAMEGVACRPHKPKGPASIAANRASWEEISEARHRPRHRRR